MNFAMWKKALQVIPAVSKQEWDAFGGLFLLGLLLDVLIRIYAPPFWL